MIMKPLDGCSAHCLNENGHAIGKPSLPILAMLSLLLLAPGAVSCHRRSASFSVPPADPGLATNGTVQMAARLVEIPEGAIFKRDLYDYATILKYEVLAVHRGQVRERYVYVGHYNPWKPRREAADARVKHLGGTLREFRAGQVHQLALEAPLEDHFMGGIVNKYFGQITNTLFWAVWTNAD